MILAAGRPYGDGHEPRALPDLQHSHSLMETKFISAQPVRIMPVEEIGTTHIWEPISLWVGCSGNSSHKPAQRGGEICKWPKKGNATVPDAVKLRPYSN